jgi:hypothetical protein
MITYVQGDLFKLINNDYPVLIPHVCNNQNKWGRGFVVGLINNYLHARTEFDQWAKDGHYFDRHQHQVLPYGLGYTQIVEVDHNVYVANMIAQVFYVHDGSIRQTRPLYYNKLCDCMEQVADFCNDNHVRILAPKFGSELAGGSWEFVEKLIEDIWDGIDVTIVEYAK